MAFELSANIELLFTEAGPDHAERVRAAADAGIPFVEIWTTSDKDLPALGKALSDTGVRLRTLVVEPRTQFMFEPSHDAFHTGLRTSVAQARDLGCERVVVTSGMGSPG